MPSKTDYIPLLRRSFLFAEMDPEHLTTLIGDISEISLSSGDTLFRHGEPVERFFWVKTGLIKLFRLSPDGDEKIIELIRPGETFAEAVMFMGQRGRYPVNAEAIAESQLLGFSQKTFLGLLSASPEACFGLLSSMSRRLHMLVNQIDSLTLQNATYRLVSYLLEQIPQGLKASSEIQLTTPKSAIASRLAIQPETLSRILARLRQGGLIDVDGAHISVLNLDALRKLVQLPADSA
ncbi:MAG: Crp/Fnr family transcriptional regulator [Gammaproteobacteria bacterium]|nr:Crp/Fnr family transcriptional regulator [Gammaproteobacteria bacterium]